MVTYKEINKLKNQVVRLFTLVDYSGRGRRRYKELQLICYITGVFMHQSKGFTIACLGLEGYPKQKDIMHLELVDSNVTRVLPIPKAKEILLKIEHDL